MTTSDRLSDLSDDLLRRILYFVPTKEAASTSVLSRRWGSLWRSSGAVNLAAQVHGYEDPTYSKSPSAYQEDKEAFFSKQEAFVHGARAALDAAEAPVTRLTLRVEASSGGESTIRDFLCQARGWDDEVDVVGAVVSHRAARRVEELRVDGMFIIHYEEENHWHRGVCGLTSLPSAATLRVLDLTGCDLTSELMAAFSLPRLETLRLRLCSVELDLLQSLLDAAPQLTTVQLESLFVVVPRPQDKNFPDEGAAAQPPVLRLRFQAATTLALVLCGCSMRGEYDQTSWAIEIDAPRLQSFKYKGHMRRFLLLRSVAAAPAGVARVDLDFLLHDPNRYPYRYDHDSDGYDDEEETARVLFWQFLRSFASARTLKLKVENELKDIAVTGEDRRDRLLCCFTRVERLELEGVYAPKSKTAAVAIANLLHCCPLLAEITLKMSTVTVSADRNPRYARHFLERKDTSDYSKSIDRFARLRKSETVNSMEHSKFCDNKYGDVPAIPGLSGRSFTCLQRTLRRVRLQFRLDNNSVSSCLGLRLIKFFADHARVLEQLCVDAGNKRLDEHINFSVETQIALARIPVSAATASMQHMNMAPSSSEFSRIPSAHLDSTRDLARSTVGFTVLPLQRRTNRMD